MIIVDFNQVMLSNLLMQIGNHTNSKIEENMVRHMVLNSLRSYRNKFGSEFGEMIIACDNTNYWRKKIFPYYKANRKKNIEKSELDWKNIFECMNKLRSEIKDYFPYKVINIESAEADDIIATLVMNINDQNILILSMDKDFIQLHKYKNVKQYDPVNKKWINHSDPEMFLKEHIIKGDFGDGIPNILSSDNCLVIGERQKSITKKRLDKLLIMIDDDTVQRNHDRNKQLIDLSMVPSYIQDKVMEEYKVMPDKDRSKLINYFMSNKLKNLTEHIMEF
jgi:hypothetical protein